LGGFTLLELSIVIAIIAAMFAGAEALSRRTAA
jgi:prepilin-type N-terminal cleavage/methylation domain-containing protein